MIKVKTKSVWENTKTYFPIFLKYLNKIVNKGSNICIVGASDGRFVIPLVKNGYNVIAIENNPVLINGGVADGFNGKKINVVGLIKRLKTERAFSHVKIIEKNFFEVNLPFLVDAIFTSSTWDCAVNRSRPLKDYIDKLQECIKPAGLFCAEYMMPCEEKHKNIEHFLEEGRIKYFFNKNWKIEEEFYTTIFVDDPHIGKIIPHNHRMGFFMAKKLK